MAALKRPLLLQALTQPPGHGPRPRGPSPPPSPSPPLRRRPSPPPHTPGAAAPPPVPTPQPASPPPTCIIGCWKKPGGAKKGMGMPFMAAAAAALSSPGYAQPGGVGSRVCGVGGIMGAFHMRWAQGRSRIMLSPQGHGSAAAAAPPLRLACSSRGAAAGQATALLPPPRRSAATCQPSPWLACPAGPPA